MARVLIVDDDDVLCEFLECSLKAEGLDVEAAKEAPGSRSGYDAVLKDIERPFSLDKLQRRLQLLGVSRPV